MKKSTFLLPALLHAFSAIAAPAPYIVTTYIEISVYTDEAYTGYHTTYSESLYTYTNEVIPKTTPVTNAISTSTDDTSYAEVTVINVLLPPGSGQTSTYDYDYGYDASTTSTSLSTSYVVPITYTPSPTCTGQNWTFVTNVPITIPRIVQTLLTAESLATSTSTYTYYYDDDRITRTTDIIAIMNPTDIAVADLESASSDYEPYGMSYCYTPTTYCATYSAVPTCEPTFAYDSGRSSSSSSSSSSDYDYDSCSLYYDSYGNCWYTDVIIIAVCVPVGWCFLWLLIGLWESWMSFKGIMLGKHRKRGTPYSWCCISWFFLCCVGPTYKAKSEEEQAVLLERWKAMKFGEKFKLWLKWGFRWKYPDVLGEAPELDKRAFRQRCL